MAKRTVRWGVIGAGGIADRKTIPALLKAKRCRLEAVMDVANIEAIAAKYKVRKYSDRIEDILCDEAVEAVYIASPVACHFEQIKAAARAGKHVLCEKPLTMTKRQAVAVVRACADNKVLLQEGYMMKFHGAHQKIRQLLRARTIGKVVFMRAQLSCWYPPIRGAWRQDPATSGGGAMMDMATHLFDLLEFFNGPVATVFARTGRLVHRYKSEDSSTALLEFVNGAHASIDCFFNIPDEASRTRLEIYGSAGAILAEGTVGQGSGGTLELLAKTDAGGYDAAQNKDLAARFKKVRFKAINPYTAECEYLADCILNRRKVRMSSGAEAIHIMDLTEKAYRSARTGRACKVD